MQALVNPVMHGIVSLDFHLDVQFNCCNVNYKPSHGLVVLNSAGPVNLKETSKGESI